MRREETAREFLDGPMATADLVASLDDVDRMNAWFRGYALTLAEIARVAARTPPDRPLVVVDVGGGRGDLAARVVRWARRAGRRVRVVVIDADGASLRLGASAPPGARPRAGAPAADILRVQADAAALPIREASADIVTSSLMLHHLGPDAVAASLGEMAAAARGAVVVNDLLRTRWAWGLVWLATRFFARHRFSRHDGPLSVRRAYAPDELRALAGKAGLASLIIVRHRLWARLLAVTS
jgi:ubiquinone/menaquinone biosynthesis C-methylase UbiE